MPFCEKDLEIFLREKGRLEITETLVIAIQVLKALVFSRSKGIQAHQDLKPGNILLQDLSNKFKDFPPKDVHESVKYRARLADFGLANAWKELGKPQGSFPYMAPEQYAPSQYEFFNPDVFAMGVIIGEMLTGLHPCGKRTQRVWKDWDRKDWEQWAKMGNREISLGIDPASKELENLLQQMLSFNPGDRPSDVEALNALIGLLFKLDEISTEFLKSLLNYYDAETGKYEEEGRLSALIEISRLPGLREEVKNELTEEFRNVEKDLSDPKKVVHFCRIGYALSKYLLKFGGENDKEKAKNIAEKMIQETIKKKGEIKVFHRYPDLYLQEVTTPLRDFEVYSEMIGFGKEILEEAIGEETTREFFENMDNFTKAAYFYCIASNLHSERKDMEAIGILDQCISLHPKKPLFNNMKALWKKSHLFIENALKKPDKEE